MLIRISLISLFFLTLVSCQANEQKKTANNSQTLKPSIVKNQKLIESDSKQKIAAGITNPLNYPGNFMTLTPMGKTNALDNPLFKLRLYVDGKLVNSFITVSGRKFSQDRNRHQSGTQAPLPDGKYTVASSTVPGSIAEAGDHFLPIQPQFKTGRSALGFHVDPSFEKNNGEDGTSGCIGLTNREDLDKLLSFVSAYNPEFLDVTIENETYSNQAKS